MPCQDCLNRREFLAKSALVAAAFVAVEGCGDGQIGPHSSALTSGGVTVKLADFPALATVGTLVDIGRERALVRTGPTTFLGLSKICTHQGCDTELRNNQLECPCHGSLFSANGSVLRGPNISSPPIAPLQQLAATFDSVANTVTVA
jgi:cytochrome b6-f complex iron-sulfur subunit